MHSSFVRQVAVAVAVIMAGAACESSAGAGVPCPATVVLVDVSRSTDAPEVRDSYLEGFTRVLEHAASCGGRVLGAAIGPRSLAGGAPAVDVSFPRMNPLTDNPIAFDKKVEAMIEEALAGARDLVRRHQVESGTDLFGALRGAGDLLGAFGGSGPKAIVVFSDAEHASGRWRLTGKRLPDPVEVATHQRELGALPSLGGIEVYMAGAGVKAEGPIPSGRYLALERFWRSYLGACGTRLDGGRYGPSLVAFP